MPLPYKIATLLYCFNERDEVLLLERAQDPNRGFWSPGGGKLKTDLGESPYTCACREAHEEMGLVITPRELHLTGLVSEFGYAGQAHWLMFLFEVKTKLTATPPPHAEGTFRFFPRAELPALHIPQTDRETIWPLFWQHRGGFFAAHCHCHPGGGNDWTVEETQPSQQPIRSILNERTAQRAHQLGVLGESLAENILRAAGFAKIKNLNQLNPNFPFGDVYAERNNQKFVISVKIRNRYQANTDRLNSRYNLGRRCNELAAKAQAELSATPAVLAISLLADVYSAYFAPLAILEGRHGIPMTSPWLRQYECLAKDSLHGLDVSHLKNTYSTRPALNLNV